MNGLVHPVYRIITSKTAGSFKDQWISCINQLQNFQAHEGLFPFRLNVFVKTSSIKELALSIEQAEKYLIEAYGQSCPPCSFLIQPPENDLTFVIEAGFIHSSEAMVLYHTMQNTRYSVIENETYREVWSVGIGQHSCGDVATSSRKSFSELQLILEKTSMNFNSIVRQWNYVPEITCFQKINSLNIQNYQAFNEIRNEFYSSFRTESSFPAATGIGCLNTGLMIDFVGIGGNRNIKTISIRNPKQLDSYKYDQDVLVGQSLSSSKNQPPQFERAKLIALDNSSRLYISGTASIIGQKTVGTGNVSHQTLVTLKNIEVLSDPENISRQCNGNFEIPNCYSYARVYVKYATDIPLVKSICESFFKSIPVTYIQADICRDDLLVEVEAEKC